MSAKYDKRNSLLQQEQERHTEDIQDIINTPPHTLLSWGITWVLIVVLSMMGLSAFLRYPEVVRAPLRINVANAPKAVVSRVAGRIVDILVEESDSVSTGQVLGLMESTANHQQVLQLLEGLYLFRDSQQNENVPINNAFDTPAVLQLGELQNGYQAFYQSYLKYLSTIDGGFYLKRKTYIQADINNVEKQREQLESQRQLLEREYALADAEFNRYKELANRKVISPAEFQQQQAALLAKQHPLQQLQSSLLANEANYTAKVKELADIDNQIFEERSKFFQALNSLISEAEQWKRQYVLSAMQTGTVVYARVIQRNQYIDAGQEVFRINSGSTDFFGEMSIPQYNMGKIKEGQHVILKLDSYPFEEYGALEGTVGGLSGVAFRDSIFFSRIELLPVTSRRRIQLTTGMQGTAEIITEEASLLQRLVRNIYKILDSK